jgi:hypothetical protein
MVGLASAPGLQYRVSLPGGLAEELEVTAGGQARGTLMSEGLGTDFLLVCGKPRKMSAQNECPRREGLLAWFAIAGDLP